MRMKLSFTAAAIVSLAAACFASETVREVPPPQDEAMLHLSVVGNAADSQFNQIVKWFKTDADLSVTTKRVHFHVIKTGTPIYRDRYAPNISGLPTVRLQSADGVVIYEQWSDGIPGTPGAMFLALSAKTERKCVLPWRRKMEEQCTPKGCPIPEPQPVPIPEPSPMLEPLQPKQGLPLILVIGIAILSFGAGGACGGYSKWKALISKEI